MPVYLSSPEIKTAPRSYHYLVELASRLAELDSDGEWVPTEFVTVDVCVVEPGMQPVLNQI